MKRRSFAFALVYIKCLRTYSVYLSFRHGVLILYRRATVAPSPFSARASAIRSRTCGRQRLAFLAASATGGARKPNPSEGGEGAPAPHTDLVLLSKSGIDAITGRRYNPSVFSACKQAENPAPLTQGSQEALSVRLSSFSKYVCGRRPLFGFIHYAARRILRAEIILQIRRHKSGYAESLRRIKALHIPAGDFSRRGSRVAGGKNAFHRLSRPKEHHFAPFPCSIRE